MRQPTIGVGQQFGKLTVLEKSKKGKYLVWICSCECGNTHTATTANLKRITGCGCSRRKPRLLHGESSFRYLYARYRANGRQRKFELTKEQFREITSSNCYYCGVSPSQKVVPGNYKHDYQPEPYIYNGIDRINNTKGYVVDNCVACCKMCNFMKGKLDHKMFVEQIHKIHSNLSRG